MIRNNTKYTPLMAMSHGQLYCSSIQSCEAMQFLVNRINSNSVWLWLGLMNLIDGNGFVEIVVTLRLWLVWLYFWIRPRASYGNRRNRTKSLIESALFILMACALIDNGRTNQLRYENIAMRDMHSTAVKLKIYWGTKWCNMHSPCNACRM